MALVKRMGFDMTSYNKQTKEFSETVQSTFKKAEKSDNDCGCLFCNPWKNPEQHMLRALKKIESTFKFVNEKQPVLNIESKVYKGLEEMFSKTPGHIKSKPVHKNITQLYEKYGPLNMTEVLEKSAMPVDFSTYKYKIHHEEDKSNGVTIGQFNVETKQFEGFIRRISFNCVYEGQWSDSNHVYGRMFRQNGTVQTGYFFREMRSGPGIEQGADFGILD